MIQPDSTTTRRTATATKRTITTIKTGKEIEILLSRQTMGLSSTSSPKGGDIELGSLNAIEMKKKKEKQNPRKKHVSQEEEEYSEYKPLLYKYKDRRGRYNNCFLLGGHTVTDSILYLTYLTFSMLFIIALIFWYRTLDSILFLLSIILHLFYSLNSI